jgi:hypothetical protein
LHLLAMELRGCHGDPCAVFFMASLSMSCMELFFPFFSLLRLEIKKYLFSTACLLACWYSYVTLFLWVFIHLGVFLRGRAAADGASTAVAFPPLSFSSSQHRAPTIACEGALQQKADLKHLKNQEKKSH